MRTIAMGVVSVGLMWSTAPALLALPQPQETPNASRSTSAADRDTTQKIRKAIVGDKNLSTYAHNVKILARDGKVTLRGPVRSDSEKQSVGEMAAAVVGADNVTNELTVEPKQ
jgi:osmotically-inducible protein OsmY